MTDAAVVLERAREVASGRWPVAKAAPPRRASQASSPPLAGAPLAVPLVPAAATPATVAATALAGLGSGAVTAAAVAVAVAGILAAFAMVSRKRAAGYGELGETLRGEHPDLPADALDALAAEEQRLDVTFARAQRERLQRDLSVALGKPTGEERRAAVDGILAREARYERQHFEQSLRRLDGGIERLELRSTRPAGARWILGDTKQHTPACIALADAGVLPWSVLPAPPLHDGCACSLEPAEPGEEPTADAELLRHLRTLIEQEGRQRVH